MSENKNKAMLKAGRTLKETMNNRPVVAEMKECPDIATFCDSLGSDIFVHLNNVKHACDGWEQSVALFSVKSVARGRGKSPHVVSGRINLYANRPGTDAGSDENWVEVEIELMPGKNKVLVYEPVVCV